jgi:hypothetical protein
VLNLRLSRFHLALTFRCVTLRLARNSGALRRMASSNSSQARSAAFHEDNDSQNSPGWPLDKTLDNVFMIHPIFLHDHLPPRFKRWYLRFERWLRNEVSAAGVCKPCRRIRSQKLETVKSASSNPFFSHRVAADRCLVSTQTSSRRRFGALKVLVFKADRHSGYAGGFHATCEPTKAVRGYAARSQAPGRPNSRRADRCGQHSATSLEPLEIHDPEPCRFFGAGPSKLGSAEHPSLKLTALRKTAE